MLLKTKKVFLIFPGFCANAKAMNKNDHSKSIRFILCLPFKTFIESKQKRTAKK